MADDSFERLILDQLRDTKQEVREDIRQIAGITSANRAKIGILEQSLKAEEKKPSRDYGSMIAAAVTSILTAVGSLLYLIFEFVKK